MTVGKLQYSPQVHSTLHIKLLTGSTIKQTNFFEVQVKADLKKNCINILHNHPHGQHHSLVIWCECWQKQVRSERIWVTKLFTGELRLPTNTKCTHHQIHSSHAPLSPRIACCRAHRSITITISTNAVTDPQLPLPSSLQPYADYLCAMQTATTLRLKRK